MNDILPALLVLSTIALVVLKVAGVLAISWLIAFLPLIILGGFLLLALVLFIVGAALVSR